MVKERKKTSRLHPNTQDVYKSKTTKPRYKYENSTYLKTQ